MDASSDGAPRFGVRKGATPKSGDLKVGKDEGSPTSVVADESAASAESRAYDTEEEEGSGKCTISPNMMKLVTLITLLVSDFDIIFTIFSFI